MSTQSTRRIVYPGLEALFCSQEIIDPDHEAFCNEEIIDAAWTPPVTVVVLPLAVQMGTTLIQGAADTNQGDPVASAESRADDEVVVEADADARAVVVGDPATPAVIEVAEGGAASAVTEQSADTDGCTGSIEAFSTSFTELINTVFDQAEEDRESFARVHLGTLLASAPAQLLPALQAAAQSDSALNALTAFNDILNEAFIESQRPSHEGQQDASESANAVNNEFEVGDTGSSTTDIYEPDAIDDTVLVSPLLEALICLQQEMQQAAIQVYAAAAGSPRKIAATKKLKHLFNCCPDALKGDFLASRSRDAVLSAFEAVMGEFSLVVKAAIATERQRLEQVSGDAEQEHIEEHTEDPGKAAQDRADRLTARLARDKRRRSSRAKPTSSRGGQERRYAGDV